MKKISMLMLLFVCILVLIGCNGTQGKDNIYKLEVVDNWNLLVHPLEEEYESGSIVEVHLHFRSGLSVGVKVNNETLVAKDYSMDCENLCQIVSFAMPNEDTTIYTHQNGYVILKCEDDKHQYGEGKVDTTSSVVPPPLIFICELCGDRKKVEQKLDDNPALIYLHGDYYGECIYENPTLSSLIEGKDFQFNFGKYNNIEGKAVLSIDSFFDNFLEDPFHDGLPALDLKTVSQIIYYELSVNNDLNKGIFIFKLENELYLFEATYRNSEYNILRGYLLVRNNNNTISTKANFTFFPSQKSDLNNEKLRSAYESYTIEHNWDLSSWGNYEIFNFTSEDIYNKYNLDVFEVYYEKSSFYFIKHNGIVYQISPFDLTHANSHCINHIAITDINDDGYIEILTAINTFADRDRYYYCTSFIRVIDTKSGHSIKITDYSNVNYFKENEDGIISIYNANGIVPVVDDLHDGILDNKYYDLSTNLFDTPVLNTSHYEFKEESIKASCDLFEAEVTINDGSIKFPYLFKTPISSPYFTINVNMKYLGETFGYTSPDGYLDGATVSFVNDNYSITCEPWCATCVVTKFIMMTGMEIEREYRYHEDLNNVNVGGIYDMVITYENEETGLKESIIIEDFLIVTR